MATETPAGRLRGRADLLGCLGRLEAAREIALRSCEAARLGGGLAPAGEAAAGLVGIE